MKELLNKRNMIMIGMFVFLIVLLSLNFYLRTDSKSEPIQSVSMQSSPFVEDQELEEQETEILIVDVKGAVRMPGVFELDVGDRVLQAIEKAGGFTEDADQSKVNLAELVYDSMMIVIPKQGEIEEGVITSITDSKIRINYADVNELDQLPGIGPSKAQAIIDYRTQFGPFQQEEDLLNVKGIGEKTIEQLREFIRIP